MAAHVIRLLPHNNGESQQYYVKSDNMGITGKNIFDLKRRIDFASELYMLKNCKDQEFNNDDNSVLKQKIEKRVSRIVNIQVYRRKPDDSKYYKS